ncbi:hypothetical protein R3P38DRAFT_3570292, partial [Favolaschia claudopus]
CQDAFKGPTGRQTAQTIANILILDDGETVECRRSNLSCNGFYVCSFAADNFLDGCERWSSDDEPHTLISESTMAANINCLIVVLTDVSPTRFYRSVTSTRCKGTFLDSDEGCNGEAVLRRFREGKQKGKAYFVGCEKWSSASSNMGTRHRFTAIPFEAREAIVVKLFRNEPLDEEDDDTRVLVGECKEIIHPSHLPRNGQCSRNHYRDGVHAIAELEKRTCDAKLSLFIPIDPNDLRAVIIPLA